ncbi:MAG: tetratricopeptide repeat protein, partial [Cyanobacteria bacterium J06555_13]
GAFRPNDDLYTYGYPDNFPQGTSVTGVCEGSATENDSTLLVFKSAQIRPGLSGSPLLNLNTGRVCGIVKFTRDRTIDLGGGAIPTTVILEQYPQLQDFQQQFHQQDRRWIAQAKSIDIPENLPRSGAVEFVGRDAVMEQLHQILQQDSRAAVSAIAGMGGVGKTELALQYALMHRESFPAGLCWLSARGENVGTQIVQFGRSLLDLDLPEKLDDLAEQVKFCWQHWRKGNVLLIFDDVTDYRAIEPYFPPVTESRFKVLITTRLRLGASVNQLDLNVLDSVAAIKLLKSLIGNTRVDAEIDAANQLCLQLGHLPLGVELVGRYLLNKPDLSLTGMLQRIKKKQLTSRALRQPEDDMTARFGVAAAFELSWDALSENAKLLGCLLSLFAPVPISWPLVEQCLSEHDEEDLEDTRDSELLSLHLLQRTQPQTYVLHPLIRTFLQAKLQQSQHSDMLEQKICQTMVEFSRQIPQEPVQQQIFSTAPFIPHLTEVTTTLQGRLSNKNLAIPYFGLGQFYVGQSAYKQAESWYEQGLSICQERLGREHLDVADSQMRLASIYKKQGRYSDAEQLYRQALTIRKKILGENHPDVATNLNDLAIVLKNQSNYIEAEVLHSQALTVRRSTLDTNHPDIAESLNNLSVLYIAQGQYQKAEIFLSEVLELRTNYFGKKHPRVISSLNNLATCYYRQESYQKAEELWLQALAAAQELFGEGSHQLATAQHNLSNAYDKQEKYKLAEECLRKALEIQKR